MTRIGVALGSGTAAEHERSATIVEARAPLQPAGPWYRQVNATQWRAFWATFLGWVLDGFDFTILTFILIDIQHSFTIDRARGAWHGHTPHAVRRRSPRWH